jgi:hypothetical protein
VTCTHHPLPMVIGARLKSSLYLIADISRKILGKAPPARLANTDPRNIHARESSGWGNHSPACFSLVRGCCP